MKGVWYHAGLDYRNDESVWLPWRRRAYRSGKHFPTDSLGGHPDIRRVYDHLLRLDPDDIDDAIAWFNRKGYTAVFFCRFIPIIRSLISIPAGTARMKMPSFLLLTALGSAIWNTVLVWLGAVAGASWSRIVVYMDTYTTLAVVVILVVALLCGARFIKKRFLAES